jgi:hypothetical protein
MMDSGMNSAHSVVETIVCELLRIAMTFITSNPDLQSGVLDLFLLLGIFSCHQFL